MSAIIFDTETTGLDEPVIVEAAHVRVNSLAPFDFDYGAGDSQCARFCPGKPISLGAMATHHIVDEDVADAPPASSYRLPPGIEYVIGHNIDFDMKAIGEPPGIKRICTLALCRKLWPQADSHTLTAMLYLLDRPRARREARSAHSAEQDCIFCAVILGQILVLLPDVASFDDLWRQSELARIPDVMTFGKHKGMRIKDVPSDYKRWLLNQPDVDPYLRKALTARAAA